MTKEKSMLKKEADKPDLKPLKKIKKHKADKPPKKLTPDSDLILTIRNKKKKHKLDEPKSLNPEKLDIEKPDFDSVQTTKKKKKHKSGEPNSFNPGKLDIETSDFDSVQTTKKKKKHKSGEPDCLNPEKLDIETPDFDSVHTTKKKKKHKSGELKSLNPEKLDIKTPDSDLVQTTKRKKKIRKSDEPNITRYLSPENIDSNAPGSDPIQTTKKKKKQKSDKPHFSNSEEVDSTLEPDSIQILKKKKWKQKSDEPQSPRPEKYESKSPDSDSIRTLEKKKKKKKKKEKQKTEEPQKHHSLEPENFECEIDADSIRTRKKKQKSDKSHPLNPEILDSEIDTVSIQTLKKKGKKKLDKPQFPNPEILDSQIETDSVRTPKKKKQKLDEPHPLNPEILDSEIDPDLIQTRKKKRKHDLDKPQSPNPELLDSQIETDSSRTLEKKKQRVDECQKPQSVNPEILASKIDTDSIQNLLEPHTKDQLIEFLLDSAVKTPSILSKIVETADQDISHRKIFVHNLDWDTTRDSVASVFEQFGELEACDIVYDRVTGKMKGFGFVIYKSRECAKNALKEPKKRINNRIVSCQWASIGKQDLEKPQSPNPELLDSQIETDSNRILEKKKQKVDDCQRPQSVNPEILDSEIDTDSIQNLLEPHTKDQLIEFLLDSAVKIPSILSKIVETADQDISHRKIFVHNLDWDTKRDSVASVFEQFGELEACDIVYDRVTGKTKGFGFVIYKSRECAKNALKEPKKRINNRIVSCQWASIGPPVVGSVDNSSRKIYVSNVEKDVDAGKLHEFFEKFGEIEVGPLGFDVQTGKSKGYALFVYKNLEGVRKALEEPNKIFDGKQLNCRMANDWNGRKKNSKSDSSVTTVMMPVPHDLSAVLPNQNMAMVGQQAGLNPMLGPLSLNLIPEGFYSNPSAGLLNQLLSQAVEGLYANPSAGLLNQLLSQAGIGANPIGQMGVGLGGYGEAMTGQQNGSLAWNQSGFGSFSGSTSAPMFQGWQHAYSDT